MATSAFKSTSRRGSGGGGGSESSVNKGPIRRSRSVSALPRAHNFRPPDNSSFDFLNKRDNPLFRSSESPSPPPDKDAAAADNRNNDKKKVDGGQRERGRSVTRNPRFIDKEEAAPTGRRNSKEVSCPSATNRIGLFTDGHHYVMSEGNQVMGGETAASGIYETLRSEVRRAILDVQNDLGSAIRKNNAAAITVTNIADTPPDLVNPEALGLVLDIRREYASKLEESQERARQLRADLAVEEHRGQELNRILKELLPDPKTNNLQKTRPQKKSSSERKKMTKRLTEEALAYFDECVSISTFDSSDFSASEDQPLVLNGVTTPVGRSPFSVQGSPSVSGSCCPDSYLVHNQGSGGLLMHSQTSSSLTASSSSDEPLIDKASLKGSNINRGRKLQFSFRSEPTTKNVGLQEDIKSYTKSVEKSFNKDKNSSAADKRASCNEIGEYRLCCSESMLYDRILCKNRTDSGTLHLCDGGGLAISVYSVCPVI